MAWTGVSSWTCLEKECGFQQWRYTDNLLFRSAIKCLLLPVSMTLMSLHVLVGSLSTFQISSGLILLGFFFFFCNLLTVPNRLNSFTSMLLLIARYRHS